MFHLAANDRNDRRTEAGWLTACGHHSYELVSKFSLALVTCVDCKRSHRYRELVETPTARLARKGREGDQS